MHSEAGWKAVQSTVSPTRLKTRLGNLGNSQKLPESHTFVWRRALPSAGKKRSKQWANGEKTADYNNSSNGEKEEEWSPKFVQEAKSKLKEDVLPSSPNVQEDPAAVEKAKEKFWGRIAVISLGAVLLSERLSGRGIVTALNMATGVPVWEIEPALGLLVGGLLAAGIYPVIRRMGARAEQGKNILKEANRGWGDSFQVATGRLAFVVLAGTILAEATTGKGILALLNVETGVEITEIEAGLTFLLLLLFTEDMKAAK